jgi:hypothetical protein
MPIAVSFLARPSRRCRIAGARVSRACRVVVASRARRGRLTAASDRKTRHRVNFLNIRARFAQ